MFVVVCKLKVKKCKQIIVLGVPFPTVVTFLN